MYSKHNVSDCPISGNSRDLSERVLPTYSDVMKCYLDERQIIKLTTNEDPLLNDQLR